MKNIRRTIASVIPRIFPMGGGIGGDRAYVEKIRTWRLMTTDHPENRYDVVNHLGAPDGQITPELNERVVGSGKNWFYILETDDDGTQRIHRHDWSLAR
jgi:hypothetical protein